MSAPHPISANPSPTDILQFADSHRVSLAAGDYTLEIKEKVASLQAGKRFEEEWTVAQHFSVRAERFALPPAAIRASFPPQGGRGDYWHTLPHVVLERSTLPWERTAEHNTPHPLTAAPWLALLVFHPDDPPPREKAAPWSAIRGRQGLSAEQGEKAKDQAKELLVPKALATLLLPSLTELQQLTHVRRRLATSGAVDGYDTLAAAEGFISTQLSGHTTHPVTEHLPSGYDNGWLLRNEADHEAYEILEKDSRFYCYHVAHEAATVLAKRMPDPGGRNQVHLVSVEGRYKNGAFDLGSAADVSLLSLHRWDFFCESTEHTFKGLLENLNRDAAGNEAQSNWGLPASRAIDSGNHSVVQAIRNGKVPLRHYFREGSKSVSWYHGPLMPLEPLTDNLKRHWSGGTDTLTVRHADQLVLFDEGTGMHEVSYAAAWELGRTLTLANTKLALQILHYKRQHAHELHSVRHLADYGYHLPLSSKARTDAVDTQREAAITKWLDELAELRHVPFNYLVPDPDLLPNESIRFFTIDRRWVECLRDGAFSVGRVLAKDAVHDHQLKDRQAFAGSLPAESGFLLRSKLVSGWPDLKFTAFNREEAPDQKGSLPDPGADDALRPYRIEKLRPGLLMVLFPGQVRAVDFFLPPETLHFGLDVPDGDIGSDEPDKLIKVKRDPDTGEEVSGHENIDTTILPSKDLRILDVEALAAKLVGSPVSAGQLALQMVSGTPLVRFIRQHHISAF
ncbi:MAG: hypothetical protein AAFN92_02965 [Bacteroidota bacterium]